MAKLSEVDPGTRETLLNHINRRWGQLYELEKEWGEKAIRYLLLTNAGGAIATLSFLGASSQALNRPSAKVALLFFVVGVVLVGIGTAKQFHHMSGLFKAYKQDVEHYFADRITWEHLNDQDRARAKLDFIDYAVPYTSFGCFIGGCVAGAIALFS